MEPPETDDPWLRLAQVAKALGICRESARQLVTSGSLRGKQHRRHGMWLVRSSWLRAFEASNLAQSAAAEGEEADCDHPDSAAIAAAAP